MRPKPMKYAFALMGCASLLTHSVHASDWNGSYAADGQCFCVGEVASAISRQIVPTPIGGQTVAQVCQRLGAGPGLSKTDGLFNYPVYADVQCGNGPFATGQDTAAASCLGSLDGGVAGQSESCQSVGASWNLRRAFSKTPAVSAAKPVVTRSDVNSDNLATVEVSDQASQTGMVNQPVVTQIELESKAGEQRPLKATVISSASTAGRKLPKPAALPSFTGKDVRIDGQRYLQARDGLEAKGGEAGSRIILDGLVFLRDDGSLAPEDLYRVQPTKPKKAVKEPVAEAPVAAGKTVTSVKTDREVASTLARNNRLKAQAEAEELKLAKLRQQELAKRRAVEQARLEKSKATNTNTGESQSIYNLDGSASRAAATAQQSSREAIAIPPSPLSTPDQHATQEAVNEASAQVGSGNVDSASSVPSATSRAAILAALRLPAQVRASSREFSYLEALPARFDVGGSGIVLEGSAQSHSSMQYVGRLGVTGNYQELMLGAGYYLTPAQTDRFTVVLLAGVEYGSFELTDDEDPSIAVDFADTGLYAAAAMRFVVNNRFEMKGGLGYSSFFEGDAMLFGGGYYHVTPSLDLVSRFELGDNDLLGIGVRFYY